MIKALFLGLIWLYQHTLSLVFRLIGVQCRFYPTCSEYVRQAFQKFPFYKAFWLSLRRVSRCHPWGGSGIDEIPE